MLLSIIIPAYQVEKYITKCIESVENQKFQDYEILLIDDGSSDATPLLCDEFERKYSNIIVIHQDNGGLSVARNVGIKNAHGMYCVFLDSDDWLMENALENIKKCIIEFKYPDVIVSQRNIMFINNNREYHCSYSFDIDKMHNVDNVTVFQELQMLKGCSLEGAIFCAKSDFLQEKSLYFTQGLFHEDVEWVPKLVLNANSFGFNNSPLFCYRYGRDDSITASVNIKRMFDKLQIIENLNNEFVSNEYSILQKESINSFCQRVLFGVICQSKEYQNDVRYGELQDRMREKIVDYQRSPRLIYRICYYMTKIWGISFTEKILYTLTMIRKKDSDIC